MHIYATSELGRCFSVKDRRAGFPASFLDAPSDDGVELKLEQGELHVRSANAMLGPGSSSGVGSSEADWLATGDLIERVGDRCFFTGRRNDVINVGGNKVQPLRVEHVIQAVPGVRDVRVFSRSSSLVGQMVACEFVPEPGFEPEEVRQAILKTCLERLDGHERPRFVQAVSISRSLTPRRKSARHEKQMTEAAGDQKGRHVIVSGGSRGLGRVLVDGLIESGYQISTFSRNRTDFTDQNANDPRFLFESADICDSPALARFLNIAKERFGPPYGLVNCAGCGNRRSSPPLAR